MELVPVLCHTQRWVRNRLKTKEKGGRWLLRTGLGVGTSGYATRRTGNQSYKGAEDRQQTKALPHSRRTSLKAKGNVKNSWYFQLQYLMIKKLILSRTKPQRGGGRGHKVPPQVSSYWWLLPIRRGSICPRGVAPGRSNTVQWTDTLKNIQAVLTFFFSLNKDTSWLSMK